MTQMLPTNKTTTIVTASKHDELSGLESAIMDACNELHAESPVTKTCRLTTEALGVQLR